VAYPVRYRLIDRETGKPSKKKEVLFGITPDGQPFVLDMSNFYTSVSFKKTSEYILEIATKKDSDGKWLYKQFGY
jgi:hypothetical protein